MASGQGSTQYNRSCFGCQTNQAPASAPYPSQLPTTVPSLNIRMSIKGEASSQPPPLPSPPQRQQGQQHGQPGLLGQSNSLSPQNLGLSRPLKPPIHQLGDQGGHGHHLGHLPNGHQQTSHMSQPLPISHSQAYPSVNPVSAFLPVGSMSGLNTTTSQGYNMQGMHPFPFHGMSAMDGYPPLPGAMPGMQSIIHQARMDAISQQHSNHTSSTLPASQHLGLGASLVSSGSYPHSGLLNGAVDKRRNRFRRRSDLTVASVLKHDDQALMMGIPTFKYDPAVLLHATGPHGQHPEADGVRFKLIDQLTEAKIRRLRDEKIKPIELLTFDDIKAYNRNQLRAYCFVYGVKRKKKADMEVNMARYAALFHPNDPAYDITKFEPTKYIDGAIPRRRTPVTKEQKERAAGNAQQLTSTIQRRPQAPSEYPHDAYHPLHANPLSFPQPAAQPPPLPAHPLNNSRIYELQTATHHHTQHHHSNGHGQTNAGEEATSNGTDMIVHDTLHVSNQLLGLSNQIVDE